MKTSKILAPLSLLCLLSTMTGCGHRGEVKVDSTKTQLYMYCNGGGYGSEWLKNAGDRFTEIVKDISFEEGKKGVQVIVSSDKVNGSIGSIAQFQADTNDLYFTENIAYNNFITSENPLLDLTDVLNEVNDYDGKKIIDKMSDQYKDYLTRDGKIYGVPHYAGYYGFAYSIEIFDKLNCYIDADGEICKISGNEKGYGPNGKTGIIDGIDYSYDDGLPSTYDEFFTMCNYIKQKGYFPVHWSGKYADMHLNALFRTLSADADGFESVKVRSTFEGQPTVVSVDAEGNPLFDDDDNLITEKGNVSNVTGQRHDIYRTQGAYYAADFLRRLTKLDVSDDAKNETVTHLDAQSHFIYSNTDLATKGSDGNQRNYAMLVDGPWWESEGREYFKNCVARLKDEKYSRQNRKFGWLALPKPTKEMVGQKNCILDHLESFMLARKSKSEEKNALIKEFVRFINSDSELLGFAKDTGVKRNLTLDINAEDLKDLSSYAKSLILYTNNTDVCYPSVQNDYYRNNFSTFTTSSSLNSYYLTNINGTNYGSGYAFFKNQSLTPQEWFKKYYSTKKGF